MRTLPQPERTPALIGDSSSLLAVRLQIALAARSSATVLVLGETGVGKEVVSRLIHGQSVRADRPFVAINCSGIPETLLESEMFGHAKGSFTGAFRDKVGLVQQANGGTLLLDELGEMSLRMQAMLLRFTETGEVQRIGADSFTCTDVRLIAATNRDLMAQVAAGTFREDLYYRLNVIQIVVPPLRERRDDVPALLAYYLGSAAETHGLQQPSLTPGAMEMLVEYPWPGNVRQLRNVAERLVVQERSGPLTPDNLPAEIRGSRSAFAAEPQTAGQEDPLIATDGHVMNERVQQLWTRLQDGEDFWTVVHQAFKTHEIDRSDLIALIDRGLRDSGGSYRRMLKIFNLEDTDYKRFHGFLHQHRANLPVGPYRNRAASRGRRLTRIS
jgi:transcriptional regulator with PAS, ATPase and Fis domain